MKSLCDPAVAAEVKERLMRLRPDSARQWGTMTPGQAVAHRAGGMELALGDVRPRRMFAGRIIGGLIEPLVIGTEQPMRRNTPTMPEIVVKDARELDAERPRLAALVDRFAAGGPAGCTTHPHSFFGRLAPREWAVLMYRHLDHHLRQFGA